MMLLLLAALQDPGLVAEYSRGTGRPLLVRIEPDVNIPLANGEFPGTRLAEQFSVRWTGLLRCAKDGMYGFYVESDDGCRLFIDGELVIDHRSARGMEQKSDRINLKAGDHELRLEYQQLDGPAGVNLQWKAPGNKREMIPPGVLFHRKGTEAVETDRAAWEALPPGAARVPVTVGRPGRYAVMDYGASLARTIAGQPLPLAYSGLNIKVGPEAAVCFDTQRLCWTAAWTGSFLKFPVERDGVAGFPSIAGTVVLSTPRGPSDGPLSKDQGRWRGHYVNGAKVVLSYTLGKTEILELPGYEAGSFTRTFRVGPGPALEIPHADPARRSISVPARESALLLKVAVPSLLLSPTEDPEPLTKGGAARWKEPVLTRGQLGREPGAYAVDTLTVPEENPWDSYMRISGLDFYPDGRAAVCTFDGDVWIVSGIDEKLEQLTWKRHAAGLYQPMGLRIRDGELFVLGRDQITRLRDLNGDGEADFHENFNNDCLLSGSFHEFSMDLQTDPAGNFYFAKAATLGYASGTPHNGCVMKVSRDGSRLEVFAMGFRTPFGLCVGPQGQITATDQQGNWMGTCPIVWVEQDKFYGHLLEQRPETKTMTREPVLCWIPMDIDNSSGGQVWATSERWGPLKDRLIHTSYGQARIFNVLIDEGGAKVRQGGVVRLPLSFASGIHRAQFNPKDGQLYVAGLRGWQTTGVKDGSLQRVRYTGKPAGQPVTLKVRKGAIELGFTDALDPETAADTDSYSAEAFHIESNADYGSPEYLPDGSKKRGRAKWEVRKAVLGADAKTLTLELPQLKPVTNLVIKYSIRGASGMKIQQEVALTINALPE